MKRKNKSKNKFLTPFFLFIDRVLCWMARVFNPRIPGSVNVFDSLLHRLDLVLKTRGPLFFILYVKKLRAQLLNYLSNNPERIQGVRVTSDGIPVALGDLIEHIRHVGSREIIEESILPFLMTILFSTRSLKAGKEPDVTPITQPAKVLVPEFLDEYLVQFWRELGTWPSTKVPKRLKWKRFHLSTKSGPNGHAMWTCLNDLQALDESLISDLCILGGVRFQETVQTLREGLTKRLIPQVIPQDIGKSIRRLIYFPDVEDKVRVVAILDYFSQSVLKPLHSYLFQFLKKIPQDRTFSQWGFIETFKDYHGEIYSVDLTQATDRFPIEFIERILKAKLPHDYVSSWRNVMVGYPFDFQTKKLFYSVGNPMGAYSSWASFAIAHHYVIYYCCQKLGKDWKSLRYCLLGDDIAIGDRDVGELYIHVVTNLLGVEVSSAKTHKSKYFFEFAKRYFYKGKEITPFPISALKESSRRYYQLVNLLFESEGKGWITTTGISPAISDYYGIVLNRPRKFRRKIQQDSLICELIIKFIRGKQTADTSINEVIRSLNFPIRQLVEYEAKSIISNIMVELFAESHPSEMDNDDLGLLAENLVIHFTGFDSPEDTVLGTKLIQSLPILSVYGGIEERFLGLVRTAWEIDALQGGEWPYILRTFALPQSDRIFTMRSIDIVSLASSIVSKKLVERLKFLTTDAGRAMLG
jgi:hypothetical protein